LDDVVDPDEGDSYVIGGRLYVFNEEDQWVDAGFIKTNITFGDVSTVSAGSPAGVDVVVVGEDTVRLDFVIPEGPAGVEGPGGPEGPVGPIGPEGPVGPQGPVGEGLLILGSVASEEDLPESGNEIGDAYLIGEDLYIWNGSAWENVGSITGPEGPEGPQGPPGPAGADGSPTGSIVMFGGTSAPSGWLFCSGQDVSRSTFSALFSVIGTSYGAGDGSTTFGLPDLVSRFPLGSSVPNSVGSSGGSNTHGHALTISSGDHSHTHGFSGSGSSSTSSEPSHNHVMSVGSNNSSDVGAATNANTTPPNANVTVASGNNVSVGGSNHFHNMGHNHAGSHSHGVSTVAAGGHAHNFSVTVSGNTGAASASTHGHVGSNADSATHTPPFLTVNYIIKT
jgi:microcystin-dependent protein